MPTKTATVCYLVTFLVLFQLTVSAQPIIPRFEHLDINDGLPHSSVYSITQDKKGFMWFGTPDGLCRYDGSLLKGYKYTAAFPDDVINNFVRGKILEDASGNIWYCNESGIYKWDVHKENITRVKTFKKNEFSNTGFQSVELDADGSMWMVNVLFGIFNFNINTGKLVQYPFPYPIDISTFTIAYQASDKMGNLWVRTGSHAEPYFIFKKYDHLYSIALEHNAPDAIFFSKEKEVQAYDDSLVYKNLQNGQSHTVIKNIRGKKVSFFSFDGTRDNYNRLWMTARGNGLFYYDEVNDVFQEYHHDNSKIKSLPFDLTTCLYIDRSQNLWIGIDGAGVARLDLKEPKFNLFPLSEGDYPVLNDYFTKCFYEDGQQRIWFGSHSNGLSILNNKTNELINYHHEKNNSNSIPGNIVGGILKDRNDNIWVGSSGGISIFDEKRSTFKTITIQRLPKLYPGMNVFVYKMIELKNGDLLAATLLGLVKIIKQSNGIYEGYYFNDKPFLMSTTTDIAEMASGIVYATISGIGMYELKPEGKAYSLLNIFFNGIDLRSVRIDEKDPEWLWVSTGKGLIHFNTRSKQQVFWNEKNGLANSYVYGSLEDEKHNLWISTNGGLSYLDRTTNHIDNYSYQDGLQSNEFNTQAFYKSNSNTFYFGGIKGFNWFRSKKIITDQQKPQVAITQIEIDNTILAGDAILLLSSSQKLAYDSNDLNFKFAVLDYSRPEANMIQYKLENWDTKWISTNTRSARYSNLPPGKYTMIVKASNAAGVWSDEDRVSFVIGNPFWKTWWFYLSELIAVTGTIIWITRITTQRKLKKEIEKLEQQKALYAERMRISQEMHDDIGAGLTQISLISESAKFHSMPETTIRHELDDIAFTSRQLVDNISEIIWALNPDHNTLDIVLVHLRETLNKLIEYAAINCRINFPEDLPVIEINNQQRKNILLVTKEIVHNAIKHSKGSYLIVSAVLQQRELLFEVSDDGVGFDTTAIATGNGLRNINQRINESSGNLHIESDQVNGTRFFYSFPIR